MKTLSSFSKHLTVLCLAACTLLLSCRSGEKLYNKGRYDEAVAAFVKKLQRRPHDATALQLLPQAYNHAVQQHEDRVNGYLRSNNPLKWESVRNEYRVLQNLYNTIHSAPAALTVVQPKDYRNAIIGAQENAAEVRYNMGVSLLNKGDKADARRAYDEFYAALKIVPSYRDANNLMSEAYQQGVENVVISQIDVASAYYQFSADQFRDYLVRSLQQRNINRFVQFFDERVARNENVRADQYLELRFYDFIVGQTYVDHYQRDVSKEIVVNTYKDTTGREINVYETVRATLFITKKTVVSKGLLDYRISDTNNGQVLRQDRIPGSYTWLNQFGTYRGDSRALSNEDRALIGGIDQPPPPPQTLFMEFTRPIYDQLERDLRSFYSNL
ncbi:tetratricopeptide repeat protein [Chitinophaga vietnamensis]|uniref:tetratricopeptide repeat protein n=1 Tax=Chitinophaga vietnamensis TaxID=2593957 RepID=UPI001177BDAB|nr:hypothetical protein [Chitinophaga vietnamensis]